MRYRDVAAAIDWLSTAFGFSKHRIITGDDGAVLYGLLTFGDHMIMVWPVRESDLDRLMKQPDEIGGAETQACYLVVEDADVHYVNAKAAGAEILLELKDHDDLGRGYSCRDPEGHIWHFGTYDPWQDKPIAPGRRFPMRNSFLSWALFGVIFVAVFTVAGVGWLLGHARPDDPESRRTPEAIAAAEAREQFGRERTAREIAERNARRLEEELALERRGKVSAERGASAAREQAAKQELAIEATQRAVVEARRELTRESEAKQGVERTLQEMLGQLALERGAKEAAERAAREAKERLADMQGESKSIAERATHEKSSKEIPKEAVERRSSASADASEVMRTRRICGDILSEPAGYDGALVELCQKASKR